MRMLEKQNKSSGITGLRFLGIVFIIAGIVFTIIAFKLYIEQLNQRSWIKTEATVTNVTSRQVSRGGVKSKGSKTVYDAVYIYENDSGESYVGEIKGTQWKKSVGEKVTVKYDPENPSESTDILEPGIGALLVNLFFGLFWIAVGIFPFVRSKLPDISFTKNKKEKEIIYSKKDISERGYPVKLSLWAVADCAKMHRLGVPLIVGLCFVVFGVLGKNFVIFYIAGALSLLFFIVNGVVKPVLEIKKHYARLGNLRFYKTVDRALSEREQGTAPMTAVMIYLDDEV